LRLEDLEKSDGEFLVKLARRAVEEYLSSFMKIDVPPDTPAKLMEEAGVFVTIEKIERDVMGLPRRVLRGCIGFPTPVMPLAKATIEAAIAAATEDPRFEPMLQDELRQVVFEVSVLSPPQPLEYSTPEDLLNRIVVGRDGLIVEKGVLRGLLLPQVPVEYDWGVEEYLSNACVKAGLPPTAWRTTRLGIYVFRARIYAEVYPRGDVVERILYTE